MTSPFDLIYQSSTRTAVLRRVVVEDGRAYIECFDPEHASIWLRQPIIVHGGGPEDYVYVPPILDDASATGRVDDAGERQVLLLPREEHTPAVVGCVAHPQMKLEEQPPEPEDTEDHAATPAQQDFAVRRAGVTAVIDGNGALVIDTTQSASKVVRLQLPAEGILRVSRDGGATERTLLAGPTTDYLQEVNNYLQELDTWAKAVQADPTSGTLTPKFTGTVPTLSANALKAATVHISSDSEST